MSDEKTKKRPSSATAKSKLLQRKTRQANRGNGETADWESVDPELLRKLVASITIHGGTVTFGYTRDGGAYYVNFYVDGESAKEYVRPTENVDEFFRMEIESWDF